MSDELHNTDDTKVVCYEVSDKELDMLNTNFTYHAPTGDQMDRYVDIREVAHSFASYILENCPPSRERSTALTHIETAMMWANASIARNESNEGN